MKYKYIVYEDFCNLALDDFSDVISCLSKHLALYTSAV